MTYVFDLFLLKYHIHTHKKPPISNAVVRPQVPLISVAILKLFCWAGRPICGSQGTEHLGGTLTCGCSDNAAAKAASKAEERWWCRGCKECKVIQDAG